MKSKRYRAIFRAQGFHRGCEGLYFKKSPDGHGWDIKCVALEKFYDKGVVLTDIGYVKDKY